MNATQPTPQDVDTGDPPHVEIPPSPLPPSPRRATHLVGGLLLLTAGVLWLLDAADVVDLHWRTILPAALIVVGVAVLVLSLWGAAHELIGVGVVLTVLVIASALLPEHISARIGDQEHRPATIEELRSHYAHGIGQLTIDLRGLDTDDLREPTTVGASVGVGELQVRVPPELTVTVVASAGVGEVSTTDRSNGGLGVDIEETLGTDTEAILRLELSVGIGRIEVTP